jgi:hypothetical protein
MPYALCLVFASLALTSCQHEPDILNGEIQVVEQKEPTSPNSLSQLVQTSESGMFSFSTFDDFDAALNAVAPSTTRPLSSTELSSLESMLGVKTMQGDYLRLVDEYDQIEVLPGNWLAKGERTVLQHDGGLIPSISDISIRTLINQEGKVKIGDEIFLFTRNMQLVYPVPHDNSVTLEEALKSGESVPDENIFVNVNWQSLSVEDQEQKTCGNGISTRGCTSAQVSDHRVRGDWGVSSVVRPNLQQVCNGPLCFNRIVSFTITPRYFANAKVEDRNWLGRWTRDVTRLSFKCGVRATGLQGSGQGWTSSSRVHEINVSWSAGPTFTIQNNGQSTSGPTLDYVTGGIDDEEISGLFCFGCCPWNCSDLDENDIP